jgi:atypical dual specificity phosphatase
MDKRINFSWVIERQLAGCAKPYLEEELKFLYSKGIRALVHLEKGGFESEDIIKAGIIDFQEYIPDFTAPSQDQLDKIIDFIKNNLIKDEPVAVSCSAGSGRTGTILTCYFVSECYTAKDAKAIMRRKGRKPFETPEQEKAIEDFAKRKIAK